MKLRNLASFAPCGWADLFKSSRLHFTALRSLIGELLEAAQAPGETQGIGKLKR
jgi:hypothetical protein